MKEYNFADYFIDLFGLKATTEILSEYENPVNPSVASHNLQQMFESAPEKVTPELSKQWIKATPFDFKPLLTSHNVEYVGSDAAQYCSDKVETGE